MPIKRKPHKIEAKPLTLTDVKDILTDVLEVLEMDAKRYAQEYTDVKTHNETLLRIFTDGHRIGLAKKYLHGLVDLIEGEQERRRGNG